MQSASACVTISELPVEGEVTVTRTQSGETTTLVDAAAVRGNMVVYGESLRGVSVSLQLPADAGSVELQSDDAQTYTLTSLHMGDVTYGPATSGF